MCSPLFDGFLGVVPVAIQSFEEESCLVPKGRREGTVVEQMFYGILVVATEVAVGGSLEASFEKIIPCQDFASA
jgi:hypothetical protein